MHKTIKSLIITTALCALVNSNSPLYAEDMDSSEYEPQMFKANTEKSKKFSGSDILLSYDGNMAYLKHHLSPNLYRDAKTRIANYFTSLGGKKDFIMYNNANGNEKNRIDAGVVIDINFGANLRGNDEKKFIKKESVGDFAGFDGFAGLHTSGSSASTATVNGWQIADTTTTSSGTPVLSLTGTYTGVNAQGEVTIPELKANGSSISVSGNLPALTIDKADLGGIEIENTDSGTYTYYDSSGALQTNTNLPGYVTSTSNATHILVGPAHDVTLKETSSLANTDQIKLQIQDETGSTTNKSQIVIPQDSLTVNVPSLDVTGKTTATIAQTLKTYTPLTGSPASGAAGDILIPAADRQIPALDLTTAGADKAKTIPYNADSANAVTPVGERLKLPHENKNIDIAGQEFFIPKNNLKIDIPATTADISNLQTKAPTSGTIAVKGDDGKGGTTTTPPLSLSGSGADLDIKAGGTTIPSAGLNIPVTGLTLVQDSNTSAQQTVNIPGMQAINIPEIPAIPAMETEKKDLSTLDLGLSRAFFYIRKGEEKNPYIFEFGKTADVTETFNIGFADIMPGADDYRFTVHANIDTEMPESAPGWQVGSDATFANLTGRINGMKRESLWFKTYAALFNESNYRYAPRVNFISPEVAGFRFAASYTPDGGDGAMNQPFSTNRVSKALTQQGVFAGDYRNIWTGAANYTYETSSLTTSISLVGEYAKHEESCISSGRCTQNFYDLKTYAISGMVSWDNVAFFGAWGDMGKSGHRRNLGRLTDGSNGTTDHYILKETPITTEGTLKNYNDASGIVAPGTSATVAGSIVAHGTAPSNNNDRVASNAIDVSYNANKGSVVDPQGGYATIQRKKYETSYWTMGASYKIDNAAFGASYFHSNAGQYDIYGGTGELDRFTLITTYKIARGITPYLEVTWFKVKDESSAIDNNLINSVVLTSSGGTPDAISTTDYNKLKNLSDGKAVNAASSTAPGSKNVRYVNQIGLFKEPLQGNKGVVLMAGIKFKM